MPAYSPTPFTSITIEDSFWTSKLEVNRQNTLPIEYQQCKDTGRIDAFRLDWKPGDPNPPHIFWDSDVAKWIEAAAYSLATHPDTQLENQLNEVIAAIGSAQQPDGYLNVHFTVVQPDQRWANLRDWHELYCAGHLMEAAVAHYQATGLRSLLDIMCRYADYIGTVFGTGEGQKRGYPGHEEIELALIKLADVTGEQKYLELARYFVDERGTQPEEQHTHGYAHYYDIEAVARGEDPSTFWGARNLPPQQRYIYNQAHLPVREQHEVTGHAVRAMYLYSAMADLARDDPSLLPALDALWQDVCTRKMYITGGIGPSRHNEGFTYPYDLPNESAYAETCAAVGLIFWNQRLLQLDCDRRYADVMERALYNGALSGVSLDGEKFFYENPLASTGRHHRQPWFDCACCPPNIARLLASLGNYIYSQAEGEIAVHLYVGGTAKFELDGEEVTLRQETRYPWDGIVQFHLGLDQPLAFGLRLRLPGWCHQSHLLINEKPANATLIDGYLYLSRLWQPDDGIRFEMDMPVERVYAHPNVRQDTGLVALQRGPLIYCLEQADHDVPIEHIYLPRDSELKDQFEPQTLGGVVTIQAEALASDPILWKDLYQNEPPTYNPVSLKAIPYYAWDNRQPGPMKVWLPQK